MPDDEFEKYVLKEGTKYMQTVPEHSGLVNSFMTEMFRNVRKHAVFVMDKRPGLYGEEDPDDPLAKNVKEEQLCVVSVEVSIANTNKGQRLCFKVSNPGYIAQENIPLIFTGDFSTSKNTLLDSDRGQGIFSMAKLAKLHKGELRIVAGSEEENKVTFILELPIQPEVVDESNPELLDVEPEEVASARSEDQKMILSLKSYKYLLENREIRKLLTTWRQQAEEFIRMAKKLEDQEEEELIG